VCVSVIILSDEPKVMLALVTSGTSVSIGNSVTSVITAGMFQITLHPVP
jgi:hypothetical protein